MGRRTLLAILEILAVLAAFREPLANAKTEFELKLHFSCRVRCLASPSGALWLPSLDAEGCDVCAAARDHQTPITECGSWRRDRRRRARCTIESSDSRRRTETRARRPSVGARACARRRAL